MESPDSNRDGYRRGRQPLHQTGPWLATVAGLTNLKREYYREYRQVEDVHWWFVGRRRILLQVLDRYIGKDKDGRRRILDVGCGTGTMLTYLASYGKAEGVDIDEEAVGYCRERGLFDVSLGEAAKLPFHHRAFELVTAPYVIQPLDDDCAALRG